MKNMRFARLLCGVLMAGLLASCMGMKDVDPSSLSMPEVKAFNVKDNGSLVFELSANVDKSAASRIAECGFYYGKDKNMSDAECIKCRMAGGSFSAKLTLREYGQTYYICSYISNGSGSTEILSDPERVQVKDLDAYVKFGAPEVVSYDRATEKLSVRVSCSPKTGVEVAKWGVCHGESEKLSVDSNSIEDKNIEDGIINVVIDEVPVGAALFVCPYVYDNGNLAYGDAVCLNAHAVPAVEISEIVDVTDSGASVSASVSDDGGAEITDKGFVYGTSSGPDMETGYMMSAGSGSDPFSLSLSELSPNRTYYIRAYAVNSAGVSYGEEHVFTTKVALPSVGTISLEVKTSSMLKLTALILDDGGAAPSEAGFYYSLSEGCDPETAYKVAGELAGNGFTAEISGLSRVTEYHVRAYAVNSAGESVGDVVSFVTSPELPIVETAEITEVTESGAACGGNIVDDGGSEVTARGVVWSTSPDPVVSLSTKTSDGTGAGMFTSTISGLLPGTKYYVRAYASNSGGVSYGDVHTFTTSYDLMDASNCFIISRSGTYAFKPVKGNSSESVGNVKSVEVLWESFGTSVTPKVGDLVESVSYVDGSIIFETSGTFREGNAVIAARGAYDEILWSWHIWFTDAPGLCYYRNVDGAMMDRNLGATSATPGEAGALGLLYQWGRKDPFLGSSSISSNVEAKSTVSWPSPVSSSSSRGTIGYAVEHPTTFITLNDSNYDWYYTGSSSTDNTRWQSSKTIYDPCPAGWRVPDGGSNGVWNEAGFDDQSYDSSDEGMLFGSGISSPATWYPASGFRNYYDGSLYGVGDSGSYWSVTPNGYGAYFLYFYYDGYVYPTSNNYRAFGQSVRCLQE